MRRARLTLWVQVASDACRCALVQEQLQALIEGYQGADRWTDDMKRSVPLYLCVDTTRDGPDTSFKALAAEVAAEVMRAL